MKATIKNNLMRKPLRKIAGAALAMLMVFTLTPAMAHADTMQQGDYKVVSNYSITTDFLGNSNGIVGTVDLNQTVSTDTPQLVEGTTDQYTGALHGSVEAADLFEGAYQTYETYFKGKTGLFNRPWENIVMFDDGGTFPTAQITIYFPSNFDVNEAGISVSENSAAISSIHSDFNSGNNSVEVTINLGNWNDYKGFFALVASERYQTGHLINIDIPYTIDASSVTSNELGTITASGDCSLYKTSGLFPGRIVYVTTTPMSLIVNQ